MKKKKTQKCNKNIFKIKIVISVTKKYLFWEWNLKKWEEPVGLGNKIYILLKIQDFLEVQI